MNYHKRKYKTPKLNTCRSININKLKIMTHYVKDKILPGKKETIDILTLKRVDTTIFITKILNDGKIDELLLSTYSIGRKAAEYIKYINVPTKMIISDNYRTLSKGDDFMGQLGIDYKKANVHAKVTLIKQKNNYYIITGSGNFNTNARIEQYTIRNNKGLYNFYKQWMDSLWLN